MRAAVRVTAVGVRVVQQCNRTPLQQAAVSLCGCRTPETALRHMMRSVFASLLAMVAGHGAMNFPRPRNSNPGAPFTADASCIGQACFWCVWHRFSFCAPPLFDVTV